MRSKTSVPSGSLDSLLSQFNSDQAGQSHSPLETSQISPEQGSSITEPAQSIAMSADETARREPGSTPKSRAHNKRYRSSPEDTIHTSLHGCRTLRQVALARLSKALHHVQPDCASRQRYGICKLSLPGLWKHVCYVQQSASSYLSPGSQTLP